MTTTAILSLDTMGISRREIVCLMLAAAIHALLFLWKGGDFSFLSKHADDFTETLVQVTFRSDLPDWTAPTPARRQGLMTRMVDFFQKSEPPARERTEPAISTPDSAIPIEKPAWTRTAQQLQDRAFEERRAFAAKTTQTEIAPAKGFDGSATLTAQPVQDLKDTGPALQGRDFTVAQKDVAFPILTERQTGALANVHAVPMPVGQTTSREVTRLETGSAAAPALQDRGLSGAAPSPGTIGGAAGGDPLASAGSGADRRGASATGRDTGASAPAIGSALVALPRAPAAFGERAPAESGSGRAGRETPFQITGTLQNRGIVSRVFPPYEMDTRVALQFKVDWVGRVLDGIIVVISSGNPSFDQRVITALKEWIFSRLPDNRRNEVQEGVITFRFRGV